MVECSMIEVVELTLTVCTYDIEGVQLCPHERLTAGYQRHATEANGTRIQCGLLLYLDVIFTAYFSWTTIIAI